MRIHTHIYTYQHTHIFDVIRRIVSHVINMHVCVYVCMHTTNRKGDTMKDIILIINQKGGVAKSTTALALGAGLHLRGERVLFIDLDAQGNLSNTLALNSSVIGLFALMQERQKEEVRKEHMLSCVQKTPIGDAIAASAHLASADIAISGVGKEMRLKELLAPLYDLYDYIILDTPPALGIITINALTAATAALIPAQADAYSLQGIGQLYDTIQTVREYTNQNLRLLGILLTRYNNRSVLSREVAENMTEAAKTMGTVLCKTHIRECIALKEAQAQRCHIFEYAPRSNAAADYEQLLVELFGGEAK